VSVQSEEEMEGLLQIGKIVRLALEEMKKHARPGMTTAELDDIGDRTLKRWGAESAPRKRYGFPGSNCISVNEEAVHGIPGGRVLQPGDLLKLDVTAERNGYVADAALTLPLPPASPLKLRLCECAEAAFQKALATARTGQPLREIGRAMESEVRRFGFRILRELHSHGVGRAIHEEPTIPNYYDRSQKRRLTEGLVITLEPILCAGSGKAALEPDGWTVRSADRSLAAHYEQTVVVGNSGAKIVTA
jgi:methionyl aminopeptidase